MRSDLAGVATIYLTPGTDQCVELHTPDSLNELAERARRSAAGARNVKSFSRLFYSQAEPCEIDGQGRIRIPQALANHAHFSREIVIVGVGFNWEIWDADQWNRYLESHNDEFDQITESTFDLACGSPSPTAEEPKHPPGEPVPSSPKPPR